MPLIREINGRTVKRTKRLDDGRILIVFKDGSCTFLSAAEYDASVSKHYVLPKKSAPPVKGLFRRLVEFLFGK